MLAPDVVTREPLNAQTPAEALTLANTPNGAFFVRSHFPVPRIEAGAWRLRVGGALRHPCEVTYDEVLALPSCELDVVVECAGNGRSRMRPLPPGVAWGDRAVGCARFRGASLADVIAGCGVDPRAIEFVFRGADEGVAKNGQRIAYERGLPIPYAMHPDTLLAYEMNGEKLPPEHGFPVRLIVPRWYGMASVKWLVEVRAVTEPFEGFFQSEDYVYKFPGQRPGEAERVLPVREQVVKSLVARPAEGARVPRGRPARVEGWAWSGQAPVARVDVSLDGGATWEAASLGADRGPYAWRAWSIPWQPEREGEHVLLSRASDAGGRTQPLEAAWNALGYANNAVTGVRVTVD